MKKTNNELLQFFGLKVGDKIKVEGFINPFVILEESGTQYFEEIGYKGYKGICTSWDIIDFIHKLLGNEYEIIPPKKKLGEMKCGEINCYECPLRAVDCDIDSSTLYEALENYKKYLNSFNSSLKPFEKTFIDALKAELDKDVEEIK